MPGQPMLNTGCTEDTRPLAHKFLSIFRGYERVVCPSGSCVAVVRHHYDQFLAGEPGFEELKAGTFELCEFLTDVLGIREVQGRFPHRVGLDSALSTALSSATLSEQRLRWPRPVNPHRAYYIRWSDAP